MIISRIYYPCLGSCLHQNHSYETDINQCMQPDVDKIVVQLQCTCIGQKKHFLVRILAFYSKSSELRSEFLQNFCFFAFGQQVMNKLQCLRVNNRSSDGQLLKTFSTVALKIKKYFPLSNMMQFSFLIQIEFKS